MKSKIASLIVITMFLFSTVMSVVSQDNRSISQLIDPFDNSYISAFSSSVYQDDLQRQFLVKNGRIYRRTESDWNVWENISYFVNGANQVGSGEITGFQVEVYRDELQRQFLTRGGEILRRTQQTANSWTSWQNITSFVDGVGQGRITGFSVGLYQDGLQRQFLVRSGQIYRRTQTASGWTPWQNITSFVEQVGQGPITAFSSTVYQDGLQRQFLTRGNHVHRRTEENWNLWENISEIFRHVGAANDGRTHAPIFKKVLVLEFDPIIESRQYQRLTEVMNAYDPLELEEQFINDMETASNKVVQFAVVERQQIDRFPQMIDGFSYTDIGYIKCLGSAPKCHLPDVLDYNKMLTDYQVCEKLNRGEIDELWLWGGPWFGYLEANMAGPGAFWVNGEPVLNTTCRKKLSIMGFNYERGPALTLEDIGHRVEGTMKHLFGRWVNTYGPPPASFPDNPNELERFTARGFDPTMAACGNIHGSLNTPRYEYDEDGQPLNYYGYDWINLHDEENTCDDWDNYPYLTGDSDVNNCSKWDCNDYDGRKYWLSKVPKYIGEHNSIQNNWWRYVLDYDLASAR